jgi:septum site-determining protein MinC
MWIPPYGQALGMSIEALSLPRIRVRGRSFMALIVTPELPTGRWFAALDEQLRGAASFFAERPIIADLAVILAGGVGVEVALAALDGLARRGLKLIGAEGIEPELIAGTRWEQLPTILYGHDAKRDANIAEPLAAASDPPAAAPAAPAQNPPSLLIDRPVRSGQSILFEDGDVTIVGAVASGAEVIAGGSIHIYGALRGRAIAGLRTGAAARIFCRKLEAELVAVDRLHRTAERLDPALRGRAVQIRRERSALRVSALD